MKVKLLKKIRKRFVITRIDKISSDPSEVFTAAAKKWGLPFYFLNDYHDGFGINSCACMSIIGCKDHMLKVIRKDYPHPKVTRPGKEVKVWFINERKN